MRFSFFSFFFNSWLPFVFSYILTFLFLDTGFCYTPLWLFVLYFSNFPVIFHSCFFIYFHLLKVSFSLALSFTFIRLYVLGHISFLALITREEKWIVCCPRENQTRVYKRFNEWYIWIILDILFFKYKNTAFTQIAYIYEFMLTPLNAQTFDKTLLISRSE